MTPQHKSEPKKSWIGNLLNVEQQRLFILISVGFFGIFGAGVTVLANRGIEKSTPVQEIKADIKCLHAKDDTLDSGRARNRLDIDGIKKVQHEFYAAEIENNTNLRLALEHHLLERNEHKERRSHADSLLDALEK